MSIQAEIALARTHDSAKGSFIPESREPVQDREKNPRGTRHINKTAQDRMPKDQRPRVQEAQRRLSQMKKAS